MTLAKGTVEVLCSNGLEGKQRELFLLEWLAEEMAVEKEIKQVPFMIVVHFNQKTGALYGICWL